MQSVRDYHGAPKSLKVDSWPAQLDVVLAQVMRRAGEPKRTTGQNWSLEYWNQIEPHLMSDDEKLLVKFTPQTIAAKMKKQLEQKENRAPIFRFRFLKTRAHTRESTQVSRQVLNKSHQTNVYASKTLGSAILSCRRRLQAHRLRTARACSAACSRHRAAELCHPFKQFRSTWAKLVRHRHP